MSLRGRKSLLVASWLLLSAIPLLPYAIPLAQAALADTPSAYVAWIPVLGFAWAILVLAEQPRYNNDSETNLILGIGLLFLVGLVLGTGPTIWPYSFVGQSLGLVLWPLWALGMAWLWFGVGVTPRLALPLSYLTLAWPPILGTVTAALQGPLTAVAVASLHVLARHVAWLSLTAAGDLAVTHLGHVQLIAVSEACSGVDSLLAVVVVLPVILRRFRGSWPAKLLLVAFSLPLAIVLNLLRLDVLVLAAHLLGARFTFDILHPVLGIVLFAVLVGVEALLALSLGLRTQVSRFSFGELAAPSRLTGSVAILAAVVLVWLLAPLAVARQGLPGQPTQVMSFALQRFAPQVAGFRRTLVGRFDDASSLGVDSASIAYAYATPRGAYVLLQIWETPSLSRLESYAYASCLAYHGDRIVATGDFLLHPGLAAQTYAVRLPAAEPGGTGAAVADAEWTLAVAAHGQTRFLRVAASAPVEARSYWAGQFLRVPVPPGGVLALSLAPVSGTWPRTLQVTKVALANFAVSWQTHFDLMRVR